MWDVCALLGKGADLTSVQDLLLPLERLRIEDGALVCRRENQAVAEWAVRQEDLETDDPPVVFRRMDSNARDWSGFLDRFSVACIEMVLSESFAAHDEMRADNRPVEESETLEAPPGFERLALPDYPMWAVEGRHGPLVCVTRRSAPRGRRRLAVRPGPDRARPGGRTRTPPQ